jgi:hypothetical protein
MKIGETAEADAQFWWFKSAVGEACQVAQIKTRRNEPPIGVAQKKELAEASRRPGKHSAKVNRRLLLD